jgi:hypothetical protein
MYTKRYFIYKPNSKEELKPTMLLMAGLSPEEAGRLPPFDPALEFKLAEDDREVPAGSEDSEFNFPNDANELEDCKLESDDLALGSGLSM